MKSRRKFTREFKLSVLGELDTKSAAEICRKYDIHPVLLNNWKRELVRNPKGAFSGKGNIAKFEAQIAERDRLIGKLYAENELLKKAIQRSLQQRAEERKGRCNTK